MNVCSLWPERERKNVSITASSFSYFRNLLSFGWDFISGFSEMYRDDQKQAEFIVCSNSDDEGKFDVNGQKVRNLKFPAIDGCFVDRKGHGNF